MNRRQLLKGLAGSALVIGFDPISRVWIRKVEAADCASIPPFAQIPPLDGTLYTDIATRTADSTDLGNIVKQVPQAVLRPGSVQDIQKMIKFCRQYDIKAAARGQHHSTFGQGLTCGLIIETSPLNTIHSIGPEGAVADAGVLWKDLLQATFPQGLRPVTTGYLGLSIGGTVSVGGCPLSNHQGALVDNVQEMTVVTGRGDVLSCSDTQHKDLFEVVLAGLGQCGIITQAKVNLLPALPMARTYLLNYLDNATFFRDFRTLAQRGELNEVYNLCFPPGSNTFVYQINATIFFDPANPPNDDYLLRGLSLPPAAAVKQDQNYVDYALFVDKQIEILKTAGWESLIKPWFDVWLADSVVEGYVGEVLASLTEFDVGPTGFMLIFAQKRAQMTRPFFRIPEGEEWVYLFDILTASALPGPNPVYIDQMLARNRRLFEQARGLGGTRYPIGALPFAKEDWMIQYGYVWPEFVRRKKKFDPDNILTPGPGIF